MSATYIKKSKIDWPALWINFGMEKDRGGRWYPSQKTPAWVTEYVEGFRSPSRAYPNSYATPLMTQKFAKMLCERDPKMAIKLKVAE